MPSLDSSSLIFDGDVAGGEFPDAFRYRLTVKLGAGADGLSHTPESFTSDCHMNPPLKRGKYSMIVDDDDEKVGTSSNEQPREGWKQCDYISNRMRLRCPNVRRHDTLKDYGFCEEHRGFIARIKQEGLRAKQCFDPSFNVSQNSLNLINDVDETLLPKHPANFPFVYESLYCDNRIDDNDNPLSRAKVFTKREIVKQYISALRRQDASIRQMRIIYQEKHRRTLHQIMELRGKSQLTKLDPTKDSQKIKRILAMRQYLLRRHNWDRILVGKLSDQAGMAAASFRHQEWMKQLTTSPLGDDEKDVKMVVTEMVNLVDECANSSQALTIEEIQRVRRKRFMSSEEGGRSFCPPLPKPIVDILEQLRMQAKEERRERGATVLAAGAASNVNRSLLLDAAHPQPETTVKSRRANDNTSCNVTVDNNSATNHNNNNIIYATTYHQNLALQRLIPDKLNWVKQVASPLEDASQVCARINRPWEGTHPQSKKTKKARRVGVNNNNNAHGDSRSVNANNKNVNNASNNNISYGTYQQYLSLQRLIPGSRHSLAKTISRT